MAEGDTVSQNDEPSITGRGMKAIRYGTCLLCKMS